MKMGGVGIPEFFVLFILFVVVVAVLVAWLMTINLLIKVGAAKGYSMDNKGLLWFIGIFATPIVVGLYVAALPDNRLRSAEEASSAAAAEDLPEL